MKDAGEGEVRTMLALTRSAVPFILLAMLLLSGCSSPNDQSTFDANTGKHIANWLPAGHVTMATGGTTSVGALIFDASLCTDCHGADLAGGISNISCSNCHLGGPISVHPSTWSPMYLTHGPSVSIGTTPTQLCANQYCHGSALQGVSGSGPSCTSCHSLPFDPLTLTCASCHRMPPNGTKYPNLAGKHGKHATSNSTSCNICHSGASSYALDHRNDVINLSILAAYTPLTGGTPTFNRTTATCANISCHGGQTTPSWYAGSINVNSQCSSCHAYGTTQYNSFNSGKHNKHVNEKGIGCTQCHDTTLLAVNHFKYLQTTVMEGPAWQTIKTSIGYNGTTCARPCHDSDAW